MRTVNTYYIILLWLVIYVSTEDGQPRYEGAQLWHAVMRNLTEVVFLKNLMEKKEVSAWSLTPNGADFLVKARNIQIVQEKFKEHNLDYSVRIENIQSIINTQKEEIILWNANTLDIGHRLNWKSYPSMDLIAEYYKFLVEEYSSLCRIESIGYTIQNESIKIKYNGCGCAYIPVEYLEAIRRRGKVTHILVPTPNMINITNGNPKNNIVIIVGGLHSSEWITITSALYIIDRVVTRFDKSSVAMKSINWLIIPVANPDGYKFTRSQNRLWKKNRRKFTHCIGADINRNFETDWGVPGITQRHECAETYSGLQPFSENEAVAIRDLILKLNVKPTALIDLHSYGNMILYPWSAKERPSNVNLHAFTAEEMAQAVLNETGQVYTHGQAYLKLYPTTGALLDWAFSQGIPHSYVIQLRDKGEYGFLLSPDQIEDTGRDVFAAIRQLAKSINPFINQRRSESMSWF